MMNNNDHILGLMLERPDGCRKMLRYLIDTKRIRLSMDLDLISDDDIVKVFEQIWRMLEAGEESTTCPVLIDRNSLH